MYHTSRWCYDYSSACNPLILSLAASSSRKVDEERQTRSAVRCKVGKTLNFLDRVLYRGIDKFYTFALLPRGASSERIQKFCGPTNRSGADGRASLQLVFREFEASVPRCGTSNRRSGLSFLTLSYRFRMSSVSWSTPATRRFRRRLTRTYCGTVVSGRIRGDFEFDRATACQETSETGASLSVSRNIMVASG